MLVQKNYRNITKKRVKRGKNQKEKMRDNKRKHKINQLQELDMECLAGKAKIADKIKVLPTIYHQNRCNIQMTCDQLGIDRDTWKAWRRESKRLDQVLSHVEESLLDNAEYRLQEMIDKHNPDMIKYFLNNKGKQRGYGNVPVQQHDININIVHQSPRPIIDIEAEEVDSKALTNHD